MATIAEFTDPRLVAIYDTMNPYSADAQPGFYSQLAAEVGAASIVDLGCGTGLITCELARQGYQLIGVDPAPAMLDIARRRCSDRVRWIDGDASRLGTPNADLAVMTGHVAQFFITDASWHAALTSLAAALRPGGRLAFESRNPGAREWEDWSRDARWSADDPNAGRVETWTEVHDVRDGIITCTGHYAFAATGEELVSPTKLRFRTERELTQSLADAGFAVEREYGDWDRRPVGPTTRELIVVAATADVERRWTAAMVEVAPIDPAHPHARYCISEYFSELDRRFDTGFDPARSIPASEEELRLPAGLLVVATLRGEPIGSGALKFHDNEPAEIKRMWVAESARGLGLGRRILRELEEHAAKHGARAVRLETNKTLVEAISLYRSAGYREVAPFNDEPYAHHWFEKQIRD